METIQRMKEKGIQLNEPNGKEDMNTIEHMIRGCAAEADGFGIDEFKPDGHFNHRLMHEPKVLLARDMDGNFLGAAIYGFSNLSRVPGSIFGAYFIVKKEARRKGVATLLLDAVCDISQEMHCDTLVFDVYINNQPAIQWLYKSGFYCTGSLRHCGYVKGLGFTDCLLFHRKCESNAIDNVISKL